MTISDLEVGRWAAVVDVSAQDAVRTRLAEFGIRPGSRVQTVQRCSGGGRVVRVGNARVALDRSALGAICVAAL